METLHDDHMKRSAKWQAKAREDARQAFWDAHEKTQEEYPAETAEERAAAHEALGELAVNFEAPDAANEKRIAEVGSVSHGTMRLEDLIPACMDVLRELWPEKAAALESEYAYLFAYLNDTDNYNDITGGIDIPDGLYEEASYLFNESIMDSMNELAPDNCYFGSHPGDGSDYGFWYDEEYEDSMMEDIGE